MWNPSQRDAVAATAAKLVEHEAKVKADKAASSGGQPLTGMDKLAKDSLDNELEMLNNLDKKFKEASKKDEGGLSVALKSLFRCTTCSSLLPPPAPLYQVGRYHFCCMVTLCLCFIQSFCP